MFFSSLHTKNIVLSYEDYMLTNTFEFTTGVLKQDWSISTHVSRSIPWYHTVCFVPVVLESLHAFILSGFQNKLVSVCFCGVKIMM